jgi:hypothetical protein
MFHSGFFQSSTYSRCLSQHRNATLRSGVFPKLRVFRTGSFRSFECSIAVFSKAPRIPDVCRSIGMLRYVTESFQSSECSVAESFRSSECSVAESFQSSECSAAESFHSSDYSERTTDSDKPLSPNSIAPALRLRGVLLAQCCRIAAMVDTCVTVILMPQFSRLSGSHSENQRLQSPRDVCDWYRPWGVCIKNNQFSSCE